MAALTRIPIMQPEFRFEKEISLPSISLKCVLIIDIEREFVCYFKFNKSLNIKRKSTVNVFHFEYIN